MVHCLPSLIPDVTFLVLTLINNSPKTGNSVEYYANERPQKVLTKFLNKHTFRECMFKHKTFR